MNLPVQEILPRLKQALADKGSAVLVAPPGSGKTTLVPLALRDAPWLGSKKILMLEPRRIAVRLAAGYMSHLLGEKVGSTVGYQVRFDRRVSAKTQVEVITEGILTRRFSRIRNWLRSALLSLMSSMSAAWTRTWPLPCAWI